MTNETDGFAYIRKMRNNKRIMRKIALLDALFSGVRQRVLATTLARPEKWWYLTELATYLRTRPSSLQREIAALAASGILEQHRDGRRNYFRAESRSPIFQDLRRIFEKTTGLIPTLQVALRPFGEKISCAFVYGSVARREERATSDVDLMVIGQTGLAELSPALRKAEKQLGREINVTSYSVDEFRTKLAREDHFLTRVLKGRLQFVKGDARDLDAIARQ
ncbi:MAG: nucleotidyltransferase domain-containing protein [Acidobacteriia bacterium]|nr:nucleotidyltransferase domain-containing protein [Terriglobia bacterium]